MHKYYNVIDNRRPEPTDVKSTEIVNGSFIISVISWFLRFEDDCDVSWWTPKPRQLKEMRETTMLEF